MIHVNSYLHTFNIIIMACPPEEWEYSEEEIIGMVYDMIKDIRDPEKAESLEELCVVYEEGVSVKPLSTGGHVICVEFTPTVPHCNLATLIGLCIRVKLDNELPMKHKLDIILKEGSHEARDEVVKQINDKERVAAAMENPKLRQLVQQCLEPSDR